MTTEELRALFRDMQDKGLRPMLCDTEVPLYDAEVPCGEPAQCTGDFMESVLMPKELLSIKPEFMVTVKGESMKDVGIATGDVVKVVGIDYPFDGDIVLACIEGEYTLKTYYEDEEGRTWLVPQNESYKPVLLDGSKRVKLCGKVKEIVKKAPRVPSRLCAKAVRMAMRAMEPVYEVSEARVGYAMREIAPQITVARLWYAVFRVMVDCNVLGKDDFDGFIDRLRKEVPNHEHLPARVEIQRMAVQSFAKPVKLWTMDNAPVKGQRFITYEKIARQTKELLLSK
ncbi:LexA family protein [Xylanibacter brevis]|uniref:LexA family protein n=1 Tax=Xylanibacter brevis TaxID=83231 RepID=UPI0009E063C6|nr:S24 family peptidase [Xylanibacter brevis]